jgi:hypothetical protein
MDRRRSLLFGDVDDGAPAHNKLLFRRGCGRQGVVVVAYVCVCACWRTIFLSFFLLLFLSTGEKVGIPESFRLLSPPFFLFSSLPSSPSLSLPPLEDMQFLPPPPPELYRPPCFFFFYLLNPSPHPPSSCAGRKISVPTGSYGVGGVGRTYGELSPTPPLGPVRRLDFSPYLKAVLLVRSFSARRSKERKEERKTLFCLPLLGLLLQVG